MRLFKICAIVFFIGVIVYAQTSRIFKTATRLHPKLLSYQGYLTDTLDIPINGNLDMTFSLYDQESGGNRLWTEDSSDVPVEKGVFNVLLGSGTAIPDSVFTGFSNCWLELTLAGTQTLSPRTKITSVGCAYTATYADTAEYARNAVSHSVPTGYSILGDTDIPPAGYTYTGNYFQVTDTSTTPDVWTTRTSMPTARCGCVAVEVNGKIYVIGGMGGLQKNEEYDPENNTWATKADMPTGRYGHAAAAVNGKIYVIGGYSGGNLDTVEVFDPSTDTWEIKTSMPTARRYLCAVAVNGKIYAIGGYAGGYVPVNEEYDPSSDSWSTKASMPTARGYLAGTAVNGKIYILGGLPLTNKNEEYTPLTDSWETKANMPTTRESHAAATLNGKVYALGGYRGSALNENAQYDVMSDTWTTKASMPTARFYLAAASVNGKIYVIGGHSGSAYVSTNEEYTPTGERWYYIHRKN